MVMHARHTPLVVAPWYLPSQGAALHRYLDDDFVSRFSRDLADAKLASAEAIAWRSSDFLAGRRDHVTLRQPVHGYYYMLSAEIACDRLGRPSYEPRDVRSAGYVIRRIRPGKPAEAWQVEDGRATGRWVPALEGADPDLARRSRSVLARRGKPGRADADGEATQPLHVTSVRDQAGRLRTIVFGYVAVASSSARLSNARREPNRVDAGAIAEAVSRELPAPVGLASEGALAGGRLIVEGRASRAFVALMRMLVERFQLGIEQDPANAALEAELARWTFVAHGALEQPASERRDAELSVADWLRDASASSTPIGQERPLFGFLLRASEQLGALSSERMPYQGSTLRHDLYVDPTRIEVLRRLLGQRAATLAEQLANEVPVARFGHDADDVYCAIPFIRHGDDACEHIAWGPASAPFRIASFYSTEAARPALIQLPSLSDLRGKPRTGFQAPQELAKKLLGIRQDGFEFEDGNGDTLGLCWSFNFSLPAITLCAFVLLMVVIALLQIVFWWLPWVFMRLPFFCRLPQR